MRYEAFHLGLHCLSKYFFGVTGIQRMPHISNIPQCPFVSSANVLGKLLIDDKLVCT